MRVLIIGRSDYLYATVKAIAGSHVVCGIITARASPESASKEDDFAALAAELGCPFILCRTIDDDVLAFAEAANADVAVSVNWLSVIGDDFIRRFPRGVLNAHCGALPDYRGNAVINWAMLRNDTELHVSVHSMMANKLDLGDIYAAGSIPITRTTTIADLMEQLVEVIPQLMTQALSRLAQNDKIASAEAVEAAGGFRCYARLPRDGAINWHESARSIDLLIRASTKPYPGAYTCVCNDKELRKLIVWRARVVAESTPDVGVPGHIILNDRATGETHVLTGRGVVALQDVQFADEQVSFRPGERFKSIRSRLGLDQGALIDLLVGGRIAR